MSPLRRFWGLWLATGIGLAAYGALALLHRQEGTLRAATTPRTIGWLLVAAVGFGLAVWWNERRPIPWAWLWVAAVVFRLLLLTTEPTLSDDVYRYLWDGHLVTEGVNPYSYVISAPELDPYEIPARRLANNPTLASPYLPTAHAVFAATAAALPSEPLAMQLVMTAFDLAGALVLVSLLRALSLPDRRVLLYLWNPLVIVEVAHGAHLDALLVFLALLAVRLSLVRSGGPDRVAGWASPTVLALATLTRPIPALLAPVLWWRWSWTGRVVFGLVLVAAVVPFGFGPAGWGLVGPPSGTGVFGSARVYSQEFRFNGGLFPWLEGTLEDLGGSSQAAPAVVAVLMVLVGAGVWLLGRRARDDRALVRLSVIPVLAYLVLTPVFHPWYLLLALALVVLVTPAPGECADRWLLLAPWWYLAAASVFSYLTYRNPAAFAELGWVRALEWLPTLGLLVVTSFWVFFAVHAEPPTAATTSHPDETDETDEAAATTGRADGDGDGDGDGRDPRTGSGSDSGSDSASGSGSTDGQGASDSVATGMR